MLFKERKEFDLKMIVYYYHISCFKYKHLKYFRDEDWNLIFSNFKPCNCVNCKKNVDKTQEKCGLKRHFCSIAIKFGQLLLDNERKLK